MSNDIKDIRFFDSHYNKLFDLPDGENIIVTHFDGSKEILPCCFIDDTHMKVGLNVLPVYYKPGSHVKASYQTY